jgi:hypothetical protein
MSTIVRGELVGDAAIAALAGGLAAGFLDELSAFALLVPHGRAIQSIAQYQASGVIGASAFEGGQLTAILGLAVHFTLTTMMAVVFVIASLRAPFLRIHNWLSGIVYGILICLVMNYAVVPMSAAPGWKPPAGWDLAGALLASCFYVGLPIASIARSRLCVHDVRRRRNAVGLEVGGSHL